MSIDCVVDRSALREVLNNVAPAVATTDVMPTLRNFHVSVNNKAMRVSGSNGVVSMTSALPVKKFDGQAGTYALPLRLLSIVRLSAGADDLHMLLESKDGKPHAKIDCGAKWEFSLMSPDGFPNLSAAATVERFPVEPSQFLTALNRIASAVSTDSLRPGLMVIDIRDGKARASDGVRYQQIPIDFPFNCSIPSRAVTFLTRTNPKLIEAGHTDSALVFRLDQSLFTIQKMTAPFPAVDEILLKPTLSNDQEVITDRVALINAIKRVRLFADEDTASVMLSLNKGSISVQCRDVQGSVAVEHVNADWSLSPRHLSFNHRHLTEFLSGSRSDQVGLRLGKDLVSRPSPLLIEDPDGFSGVISQIRMDWRI